MGNCVSVFHRHGYALHVSLPLFSPRPPPPPPPLSFSLSLSPSLSFFVCLTSSLSLCVGARGPACVMCVPSDVCGGSVCVYVSTDTNVVW